MARDMELAGAVAPLRGADPGPVTIADGKTQFLDSLRFQGLAKSTMLKHETLWRQATAFAVREHIVYTAELTAAAVARFMKTWADGVPGTKKPEGALARGKKLERFRQFFKFAVRRKWIDEDPTRGMKGTKVKHQQTPPFAQNEMAKILAEADRRIRVARTPEIRESAMRSRALILFMRFSGLRIGDAVGCQIEWVKEGRVRLVTQKNHRRVDVELPVHVVLVLATTPPRSDLYWFWTGISTLKAAVSKWERRLLAIFRGAGIQRGHAHRFRDTFAVAMLERGESLQAVADALGNTLEVTEKHYNPWSKMRQSRLDEAVRAGWEGDGLLRQLDARVNRAVIN
jgi:site-specific recombinase XerD